MPYFPYNFWIKTKTPLERKLEYVARLASVRGTNEAMLRWELLLPLIKINLGGSVLFRLLLDCYLALNLNIDSSDFEWHNIDFLKAFVPEFPPHWYTPNLGTLTPRQLEYIMWSLRENLSTREGYFWKMAGNTALNWWEWFKELLSRRGVDPFLIQMLQEIYVICEAKMRITTYVGSAIVGVSAVMPNEVEVRDPQDYRTIMKIRPKTFYENYVGLSRVGFARVVKIGHSPETKISKYLADHIKQRVDEFRTRVSLIPLSPEKILWQRVFFWFREDKLHVTGGQHQVRLQNVIQAVKQIVEREGVMPHEKLAYIAFAQEVLYKDHPAHKHWKTWKSILSDDEIVEKYVRMGCDEKILRRILGVIKP